MKIVNIDTEEFIKLYNEGASYRKLAKTYGCGTTKIQNMKVELGLSMRVIKKSPQAYLPKQVDEKRFREMYDAGLSYQEIGDEFKITTVRTVAKYVGIFGLPERDRTLARIDKEKFTQMYLDGCSFRGLCKDFRMTQNTLQRVIKAFGLPDRTGRNNPADTPKLLVTEFEFDDFDRKFDRNSELKKMLCVPTLRELEKKQQAIDMIRAETEYKNKWRKDDGRN